MPRRVAKSYTIDPEVERYVSSTKGKRSASERVNELIKQGIKKEQYELLEREAAAFFALEVDRTESMAFHHAGEGVSSSATSGRTLGGHATRS